MSKQMFSTFYVCTLDAPKDLQVTAAIDLATPARWMECIANHHTSVKTDPSVGADPVIDIVGHRHLFDLASDERACLLGGYVTATVRTRVRKIPSKLLQARVECECERIACEQEGRFITRAIRKQVHKDITEAMLPQMPLTLDGCNFTYYYHGFDNGILFVEASTSGKLSSALGIIGAVSGYLFAPVTPYYLAGEPAVACSISCATDRILTPDLGADFLTWLFYQTGCMSDNGIKCVVVGGGYSSGKWAIGLSDGPISMVGESEGGANVVRISDGLPALSPEAYQALREGKRLVECELRIAYVDSPNRSYSFRINSEFRFSSVTFPDGETFDPDSIHADRIHGMLDIWAVVEHAFRGFSSLVANPDAAANLCDHLRLWVQGKLLCAEM